MIAIRFILESLQALIVTAFLLRVLLPLVRADSRNPFSQAILRFTNPLVLPLRRAVPPIGKVDTASLLALLLMQIACAGVLCLLGLYRAGSGLQFTQIVLLQLTLRVLWFYTFSVFIHVLLSWVAPNTYSPVTSMLNNLCEPLLQPVRRVIPPIAGLDLSAAFVLIGLQALILLMEPLRIGLF